MHTRQTSHGLHSGESQDSGVRFTQISIAAGSASLFDWCTSSIVRVAVALIVLRMDLDEKMKHNGSTRRVSGCMCTGSGKHRHQAALARQETIYVKHHVCAQIQSVYMLFLIGGTEVLAKSSVWCRPKGKCCKSCVHLHHVWYPRPFCDLSANMYSSKLGKQPSCRCCDLGPWTSRQSMAAAHMAA